MGCASSKDTPTSHASQSHIGRELDASTMVVELPRSAVPREAYNRSAAASAQARKARAAQRWERERSASVNPPSADSTNPLSACGSGLSRSTVGTASPESTQLTRSRSASHRRRHSRKQRRRSESPAPTGLPMFGGNDRPSPSETELGAAVTPLVVVTSPVHDTVSTLAEFLSCDELDAMGV